MDQRGCVGFPIQGQFFMILPKVRWIVIVGLSLAVVTVKQIKVFGWITW